MIGVQCFSTERVHVFDRNPRSILTGVSERKKVMLTYDFRRVFLVLIVIYYISTIFPTIHKQDGVHGSTLFIPLRLSRLLFVVNSSKKRTI